MRDLVVTDHGHDRVAVYVSRLQVCMAENTGSEWLWWLAGTENRWDDGARVSVAGSRDAAVAAMTSKVEDLWGSLVEDAGSEEVAEVAALLAGDDVDAWLWSVAVEPDTGRYREMLDLARLIVEHG